MEARLSDRDVRELLGAVRDVSGLTSPEEFGRAALRASMRLVPCEVGTYNEVDAQRSQVLWEPEGVELPDSERLLAEHQHEHPLIQEIVRTGDGSPRAVSDLLSPAQFRQLSLYRLVFEPMGLEDQLAVGLPAPRPLVIGIALNRARRGFAGRERTLLQLFRPHLVQGRANARLHAELRRRLDALEDGAAAEGRGVLLAHPDGSFEPLTPSAERALHRYFDSSDRRLPAPVAGWLADERARLSASASPASLSRPLLVRRGRTHLMLRRLVRDGDVLILSSERAADPGAEALVALGLTRREAEVLHGASEGLTNPAIAARLHVSLSTVKRHLESVYRKLGVPGRAAAAAYAAEMLATMPVPVLDTSARGRANDRAHVTTVATSAKRRRHRR